MLSNITYLNPEFMLFMPKGSKVFEKVDGSTLKLCHALLSHKTSNEIYKSRLSSL